MAHCRKHPCWQLLPFPLGLRPSSGCYGMMCWTIGLFWALSRNDFLFTKYFPFKFKAEREHCNRWQSCFDLIQHYWITPSCLHVNRLFGQKIKMTILNIKQYINNHTWKKLHACLLIVLMKCWKSRPLIHYSSILSRKFLHSVALTTIKSKKAKARKPWHDAYVS